jgi:hypothetical protein
VIADVEKPCFHALLIQYHGYKLLLLEYAVLQIFVSPELDLVARLRRLQETTWGRHFVLSAKAVLTEFVRFGEQPYSSSLSHAPDHLFNLVCVATLLLIKAKHLHGASQPYPLSTLTPLVERVTEFLKRAALTQDHLPMRCAMLIETLMKAYERIQVGPTSTTNLGKAGETGTPSNDGGGVRRQPEPPRTSISAPTNTPLSAPTTSSGMTMIDGNFVEGGAPELNLNHELGFDGLVNLDQMGGVELFFSQPIWPESALLGQVGQQGSGGVGAFDLGNLLGLYDMQPQF